MNPTFFSNPEKFRDWLEQFHKLEIELLVGFHKINSGKQSMTWSESVDEALCYGWIDGVRKSIDADSYSIRFTPRKAKSIWSAVNLKKMEVLIANGKMQEAGLKIFSARDKSKQNIYSFEREASPFPEEFKEIFKSNAVAWAFFNKQSVGYKKLLIHWVIAAKQETTRLSRLEKLICESEKGIKLR